MVFLLMAYAHFAAASLQTLSPYMATPDRQKVIRNAEAAHPSSLISRCAFTGRLLTMLPVCKVSFFMLLTPETNFIDFLVFYGNIISNYNVRGNML